MRASDRKRPIDAKAERAPRNVVHPIHDLDGMNHERVHLLRRGQLEIAADQLHGELQGIMLFALL